MSVGVPARLEGVLTRDGIHVAYQVFGDQPRTVLLLPPWSICHSAIWRHQVQRLAERYTVVTFDGRGNGASDRPLDPANYTDDVSAADALAVLDALGIEEAAVASVSGATRVGLLLAGRHRDRVPAAIFIAPSLPIAPPIPEFAHALSVFDEPQAAYTGWLKFNRHYWQQDWPDFLAFFMGRCLTEPDSTVEIGEYVEMGAQTTADVITATADAPGLGREEIVELAAALSSPALVIHGAADAVSPVERGQELARLSRGERARPLGLRPSAPIPEPGTRQSRDPRVPGAPRPGASQDIASGGGPDRQVEGMAGSLQTSWRAAGLRESISAELLRRGSGPRTSCCTRRTSNSGRSEHMSGVDAAISRWDPTQSGSPAASPW